MAQLARDYSSWHIFMATTAREGSSAFFDSAIERQLAADRREQRMNARLRCRARDLKEAGEIAGELLQKQSMAQSVDTAEIEIRRMSPLELGMMYAWMAAEEAESNHSDTTDEQRVSRWWGGGAVGIQETYEASAGWFDEEIDAPPSTSTQMSALTAAPHAAASASSAGRPAAESVSRLKLAVEAGSVAVAKRLLGAEAARNSVAVVHAARLSGGSSGGNGGGSHDGSVRRRPHLLGAFAPGEPAPVGFIATKLPPVRPTLYFDMWAIDAMGTRVSWRGRGIGSRLARHCLAAAAAHAAAFPRSIPQPLRRHAPARRRPPIDSSDEEEEIFEEEVAAPAAGGYAYCIDVVPSAVGFWEKLGFVETKATGEQAYYLERGGDRPMVKYLSSDDRVESAAIRVGGGP